MMVVIKRFVLFIVSIFSVCSLPANDEISIITNRIRSSIIYTPNDSIVESLFQLINKDGSFPDIDYAKSIDAVDKITYIATVSRGSLTRRRDLAVVESFSELVCRSNS